MNSALYDSSFTLYAVVDASPQYKNLLSCEQSALNTYARDLKNYVNTKRPAYENEEERDKVGNLRGCNWIVLRKHAGQKRKRGDDGNENDSSNTESHNEAAVEGLMAMLTYDKATYKFVFYTANNNRKQRPSSSRPSRKDKNDNPLPLLLVKSNASLTRTLLAFLHSNFNVSVSPLDLPVPLLQQTLQTYVTSLYTSLQPVRGVQSTESLLRDTIGNLKVTLQTNTAHPNGLDIAKGLRTIDIGIPSQTLTQLLTTTVANPAHNGLHQSSSTAQSFLVSLQTHIRDRTGLILPLPPTPSQNEQHEEGSTDPPLKITRISTSAFALSAEGRLKLSSKAVDAVDLIEGLGGGDENEVRMANVGLIESLVTEARTRT